MNEGRVSKLLKTPWSYPNMVNWRSAQSLWRRSETHPHASDKGHEPHDVFARDFGWSYASGSSHVDFRDFEIIVSSTSDIFLVEMVPRGGPLGVGFDAVHAGWNLECD
jgi:hypothetical protein